MSRVRKAEDLILAQPFNPLLFRQGPQIGPHTLTRVWHKRLRPEDAEAEWRQREAAAKARHKNSTTMHLHCAICDRDHPQELFPLPPSNPTRAGGKPTFPVEGLLPQGHWRACLLCRNWCDSQTSPMVGKDVQTALREIKEARAIPAKLRCAQCKNLQDRVNYDCKDLRRLQHMLRFDEAVCIACNRERRRKPDVEGIAEDVWTCTICNKNKTLEHFDPHRLKRYRHKEQIWCTECATKRKQVPCARCGVTRCNWGNGIKPFLCTACRYPPCVGCGKPRPAHGGKYMVTRLPVYRCKTCTKGDTIDADTAGNRQPSPMRPQSQTRPRQRTKKPAALIPSLSGCKQQTTS